MNDIDGEIIWAEIQLQSRKKMYAGAFYRPPDHTAEQLEALDQSLNIIMEKTRNNPDSTIIMGGDFNAKDINWDTMQINNKSDKPTMHNRLLEILEEHHLVQHQLEPTRENNILDLFCTNKPGIVKNMHTIPGISDHDIPLADCDIKPRYTKKPPRKVYNYKKADWDMLREEAKSFTADFLTDHRDRSVEENWSNFKKHIETTMDKHIPSKLTSTRHNLPWVNSRVRRMINKKQRLYNKAKKSHKQRDWDKYRHHKNETNKIMKKTRWEYINNILVEGFAENNTKPFWKLVKSRRQENIGVPPLKVDGNLISDSKQKAEILNSQFQSVFTKDNNNNNAKMNGPEFPSISPLAINTAGVRKLLSNLKVGKASGPDNIPSRILKELSREIAPALTAIFNQSIEQHTLPKDWLQAYVAPIYKKGNQNLPENYRPVSLTSVCCKILEHVICKHILNHLDLYKILNAVQHGFRFAHSCESQLLITLQDLMKYNDNKIQIDIAILDFSKAFDTVPHDSLLQKLHHYGIQGNVLLWISEFLKNRQQSVVIDGKHSEWIHVDSGVPQGTVLGPLLFLLHSTTSLMK